MNDNIITQLGYNIEMSISGYYRLMKNNEVIYDDSASDDLNEDYDTALSFFESYLNEYAKAYEYKGHDVVEDEKFYHIGEDSYCKSEWTLDEAIQDKED